MKIEAPGQPWQVRQTVLEVRLPKLKHNFEKLVKSAKGAEVLVVVKADAYGHGLRAVTQMLEKLGDDSRLFGFGVANVEEGIELRRAKTRKPVLIMSGIQHFDGELLRCLQTCTLTPVIASLHVLKEVDEILRSAGVDLGVHLKFNTGMNRLGFDSFELGEVAKILKANPRIRVEGLMSHYASADIRSARLNARQTKRFREVVDFFREAGIQAGKIHIANSAGLQHHFYPEGNLVRAGLHFYGAENKAMRPALHWTAQVYQIREIAKGETVGYDSHFVSKRKMRTAILGVGYADGYRRSLMNRADVLINGKRCRVLGAVSMDLIAVDITKVRNVSESSRAVLLGEDGSDEITVEELAKRAGCIPWEIFTGISSRVPRRYSYD